ncbi:TauD/TfdA family dioxygenase [Streptomyces sp. NPDC056500]|uniref:TauD/TfdA family dioxygenase n=1 Tax=Streptomyces sp. NPDC056500 TaxID=3345840 RepID=UPI0036984583
MADIAGIDLAQVLSSLEEQGYCHIKQVPDSYDYISALSSLGPLVAQYQGDLIREVQPNPAVPEGANSAASTSAATPHTEFYEFPGIPPRYVALWCIRPAVPDGGATTLADGYRFLAGFTADERLRLSSEDRDWRSRPTLSAEGIAPASCRTPVLVQHRGRVVMRFSTRDLTRDGELTSAYIDRGQEFFNSHHIAVRLEERAILIWDNWRMIHARTAFDDRRRHLRRILIGEAA